MAIPVLQARLFKNYARKRTKVGNAGIEPATLSV